ncbi:serine kinase [Allopontixanthobacter sp.]|uniref:HPr kinase/phosphorylase n=1 Tax=Allopontixanthobacter sp. TaxID=2906452 RepID=UPI002ABA23E9|nr:serine kinase [Allopontixanthobacter sp.]MDZ4307803.1 serine kinase [Allopontixanthobacter sp.]
MIDAPRPPPMVLHQAGCIAVGGRGILIEGPPGSGKTTLALMLLDRGAALVGDDGVELAIRLGHLWAMPPAHTAGKLEIRGVGIIDLPVTQAPVSLRLILSPDAPRYIEQADSSEVAGARLPTLLFDPGGAAAAIRAEYALDLHGLPMPAGSG